MVGITQGDKMPVDSDPASGANLGDISTRHMEISWRADFEAESIVGSVTHTLRVHRDGVQHVVLDVKELEIRSVKSGEGKDLSWRLEPAPMDAFGQQLRIELGQTLAKGAEAAVQIAYTATAEGCSALQWLPKEQTADAKGPFLFSQCQAIHARTLLPCQDCPAVKATYEARVEVPKGLTALMSAVGEGSEAGADDGWSVFKFRQAVPIPSYLIAVVVGVLERRELSERSAVWAEPSLVEAAAYEFAETDTQLKMSEELLGPYVWGRYDLLVLPPTFPYGGMENPCLTFVTPTLIAGDRSLADVIQHEITHSWTGNLVTNATWDHFWLNEGFTTFAERKATARLKARQSSAYTEEQFRQASAIEGWRNLEYAVHQQFTPVHKNTRLLWDTAGTDPDDAFSMVPYEKGHTFLVYLERLVGGPAKFEPWLRGYLRDYQYKALTTEEWKAHFTCHFADADLSSVDWDAWFTGVGMPPFDPAYDDSLFRKPAELAARWLAGERPTETAGEFAAFTTLQKVDLLCRLEAAEAGKLSPESLDSMAAAYQLSQTRNSEVRFRWIRLALKQRYEAALDPALDFVTAQGRMKYTRPVYKALMEWDWARPKAVQRFKVNRISMHSLTASLVSKDFESGNFDDTA